MDALQQSSPTLTFNDVIDEIERLVSVRSKFMLRWVNQPKCVDIGGIILIKVKILEAMNDPSSYHEVLSDLERLESAYSSIRLDNDLYAYRGSKLSSCVEDHLFSGGVLDYVIRKRLKSYFYCLNDVERLKKIKLDWKGANLDFSLSKMLGLLYSCLDLKLTLPNGSSPSSTVTMMTTTDVRNEDEVTPEDAPDSLNEPVKNLKADLERMGDDNAFIVDENSTLRAENSRLNEENLALQDKIDLLNDVESAEEGNTETRATTTECDGLRAADELLRKELADLRGEVAQIMHALRSPDGKCSDVSDTSKAKTLTTKFNSPSSDAKDNNNEFEDDELDDFESEST